MSQINARRGNWFHTAANMTLMDTPQMPPRYIVVEADLFVSEDLCEILRADKEHAHVVAVRDLSGACSLLSDGGRVDIVFLNGSAARTDDPTFLTLMQGHGAFLVRIGEPLAPTQALAHTELSIPAPFTNDAIMGLLNDHRLARERV